MSDKKVRLKVKDYSMHEKRISRWHRLISAPLSIFRFTYPYPRGFYKPDDFISDEMSEHGSIDFVALDGDGCHGAGSTEMQNSSPVSRRKQKAKLRKRRQKALKALAKQTAQALNTMVRVHDIADSTTGRCIRSIFLEFV